MTQVLLGVLRHFRSLRGPIIGIAMLALVSAQCEAGALILLVPLAKAVSAGDDGFHGSIGPLTVNASVNTIAALAAGLIVVAGVLSVWLAWVRARVMANWELGRRNEILRDYLGADFTTQAGERMGTLGTLSGYSYRGSTAFGAFATALNGAITVAILVTGAIVLDWRAAIVIFVMILLLSGALRPGLLRTRTYSQALATMQVDYNQQLTEATRMAREVRVFRGQTYLSGQLGKVSRRIAHVRHRSVFVAGAMTPIYQYVGLLFILGALVAARSLLSIDVAEFGAIALLLVRSVSYGQQLQSNYQVIVESAPYLDKLDELRDLYLSHSTSDGTVVLEGIRTLALDHLTYSYDGQTDALADVSVSFYRGEVIGVVGPSGSGKSTLSQLLLRLRTPTAGRIVVDGVDAAEFTLASWYQHVSLVPQDPRLLHASVAENVAFLDPTIDRDAVVAAAKAAGIHDVIEALDEGYDTLIGPAFRDLSGGQVQRVGIARALARGAEVLVLDEPTSALDVHSEAKIQTTLEGLRGSAMVLVIAHRLSTLSICDRILVLNQGAVETVGTLAEVSRSSDFFRRAMDAGTLDIGTPQP